MKLSYQNYGSSILLIIEASSNEEAHGNYLSLWNWNATSSDPSYIADGVISCWSNKEKLKNYFFNKAIDNLRCSGKINAKGQKHGYALLAQEEAAHNFAAVEVEKFRSYGTSFETASFGTIVAEKPDSDFKDACMSHAFAP